MKKFVKLAAVLISSTAAGVLVWRKVESDRLRNDLWTEAEKVSAPQAEVGTEKTEPVHAGRG